MTNTTTALEWLKTPVDCDACAGSGLDENEEACHLCKGARQVAPIEVSHCPVCTGTTAWRETCQCRTCRRSGLIREDAWDDAMDDLLDARREAEDEEMGPYRVHGVSRYEF